MQEASRKTEGPYDREAEAIPRLIMLLFVGAFAGGAVIGYFTEGFGFFSRSTTSVSIPTSAQSVAPSRPEPQTRVAPAPKPIAAPVPVSPQIPARVRPPATVPAAPQTKASSPAPTSPTVVSGAVFRVQAGAFRNRENAETLVQRLQQDGFQPYINYVAGMHRVRFGPFSHRADADQLAEELRAKNYDVFVTR